VIGRAPARQDPTRDSRNEPPPSANVMVEPSIESPPSSATAYDPPKLLQPADPETVPSSPNRALTTAVSGTTSPINASAEPASRIQVTPVSVAAMSSAPCDGSSSAQPGTVAT